MSEDRPINEKVHSAFCAGKIAFGIEVKVDTREMANWSKERITALFDGIALVQRAMAGDVPRPPEESQ